MRCHEFSAEVDGWDSSGSGDIDRVILEALNEYDGDSDSATARVFIVPKEGEPGEPRERFIDVRARWIDEKRGWFVTGVS